MPIANDPIKHVVLLMLENRSFDHLLGDLRRFDPSVEGIDPIHPPSNPRTGGGTIAASPGAKFSLPKGFDPKHEFLNVITQIGGPTTPNMQGFVIDAETELGAKFPNEVPQVMTYFPLGATPAADPLPALQGLARAYTVCDHWFASVPGPTWPNRFFALAGTCRGYLRMPDGLSLDSAKIALRNYDMPTIFNRLIDGRRSCRIYHHGPSLSMLLRATWPHADIYADMDNFAADAAGRADAFPDFTLIEPDYFNTDENDQHPPSDVRPGDRLIATVYNAIRANDALWSSTLLVVLYDEHGGFSDHVVPPATISPDDKVVDYGFNFDRLGLRVPALLVSPYARRTIDHTIFDHTSLLRYLCDKWDLEGLGKRAAAANSIASLMDPATHNPGPAALTLLPAARERALGAQAPAPNDAQRAYAIMLDQASNYLDGATASPLSRAIDTQPMQWRDHLQRRADDVLNRLQAETANGARSRSWRTGTSRAFPDALRVLMVHGIGHEDADSAWQQAWQDAFVASAHAGGWPQATRFEIKFTQFDNIFESFPLDPLMIAHGMAVLALDALGPEPEFGTRALGTRGLYSLLRWTAGMVVQWIENPELRAAMTAHLLSEFAQQPYDLVCAHSLGGMACYDAFRQQVVAGQGAQFDRASLVTFGSQFAHPAVQSVFGGRIAPLYDEAGHGFADWFHVYSPHDCVFTRPLPGGDARTHGLTAHFNHLFDPLNHNGEYYLGDAVMSGVVLPGVAAPVAAPTREVARAPVAITNRAARHRALLVGINEYPDPALRLNGCVNDVYRMSQVLQSRGFAADDIRVLTDSRATRDGIMERLEWLSEGAARGAQRVFFYSGHGAQLPSYGATDEPDRQDETLVPVDFDWSRAHAIIDDDFRQYYSHLPYDLDFLAVFDCCHAGGMTRGAQRVRGIDPPDDIRHRALRWDSASEMWVPRDFVARAQSARRRFAYASTRRVSGAAKVEPPSMQPPTRRGFGEATPLRANDPTVYGAARSRYGHYGPYLPMLVYAAGEEELAAEYDHGSVSYGAFTYALTKRLSSATRTLTFAQLVKQVRDELASLGYQQRPQIVGPRDKITRRIPLGAP